MIYDCFQFHNEIDLLEIRLNVLNKIVDRFVITESTITHSGLKKELNFKKHEKRFSRFKEKIIYNVITDSPNLDTTTPFDRDGFQKIAVARGLVNCNADDIIIYSDVDEIPNPEKVLEILKEFNPTKIYHFAQRLFYFYLNYEEISGNLLSVSGEFPNIKNKKWLGTKVFQYSYLSGKTLESLRFPDQVKNGIRVDDGGWHFSYVGGDQSMTLIERFKEKQRSFSHQEFNKKKYEKKLKKGLVGNDIFGRTSNFIVTNIDINFPSYICENIDKYKHLIATDDIYKRGILQILEASHYQIKNSIKKIIKSII